jgi:polysaccharide deacetylase family protein (PEP-CTERM system associated)
LHPVVSVQRHHFTVDVEEYFHVAALERTIARDRWDETPSRLAAPALELLDLLAANAATATFFILGWVARRHPDLVRRIVRSGHEVASHGWAHERVPTLTPAAFRTDVRDSKRLLEDIGGASVLGYRAPSFSIVPGLEWAFDILLEEGYTYDSSVFPGPRLDGNRSRGANFDPYWITRPAGRLREFPPTVLRRLGMTIPAGGGGYFRILPYGLTQAALRDHERRGVPGTFYIHPWELDPDQPRVRASALSRVRHYTGLSRTRARLQRLLAEFSFTTIRESGIPA